MTADREARRFELHRDVDETGISGTGVVAEGIAFSDGVVALRWIVPPGNAGYGWPTSVVFHDRGVESLQAVHGHNGKTRIVWLSSSRPGMLLDPAEQPPLPDPGRDACCNFCGTVWPDYHNPRVLMDCCDARRMIEHHRVQRDEARADADRLRATLASMDRHLKAAEAEADRLRAALRTACGILEEHVGYWRDHLAPSAESRYLGELNHAAAPLEGTDQ